MGCGGLVWGVGARPLGGRPPPRAPKRSGAGPGPPERRTDRPRRARRGLITRLAPPRGGVPQGWERSFARVGPK